MTDVDAGADVTPEVVRPDILRADEDDDAASEFGSHAVARPRPMVIRSVNTKSRGKGRIKPRLAQVERMGGVDDAAGAIEALASMPRERGRTRPTPIHASRPTKSHVRSPPESPPINRRSKPPSPFTAVADHDPDRASGELPTDPPPRYPYYVTDDGDRVVPRLDWTNGSQRNRACDLMRRYVDFNSRMGN